MRRSIAALVVATLLATACQTVGGSIVHPTGANELVLRIETGGGLVPWDFQLGQVPELSIFGDGRVIVTGPQIAIYPGPALPNLVTFRLSEDGLQRLLENARAAGLLGPDAHYDYPGIADAPTTTFTVVADGKRHVVSAYALSMTGNDVQVDPAVRRARAALAEFEQKTSDLRSWLADRIVEPETVLRFESLRVYATAAAPDASGGVEPNFADWPLSVSLAAFGGPASNPPDIRCGVVEGADLVTLLPAIQASNELTFWRSEGATYHLVLRPLLPDESGCPTTA